MKRFLYMSICVLLLSACSRKDSDLTIRKFCYRLEHQQLALARAYTSADSRDTYDLYFSDWNGPFEIDSVSASSIQDGTWKITMYIAGKSTSFRIAEFRQRGCVRIKMLTKGKGKEGRYYFLNGDNSTEALLYDASHGSTSIGVVNNRQTRGYLLKQKGKNRSLIAIQYDVATGFASPYYYHYWVDNHVLHSKNAEQITTYKRAVYIPDWLLAASGWRYWFVAFILFLLSSLIAVVSCYSLIVNRKIMSDKYYPASFEDASRHKRTSYQRIWLVSYDLFLLSLSIWGLHNIYDEYLLNLLNLFI